MHQPLRGKVILIVEDDPISSHLLEETIELEGGRIISVYDGVSAIKSFIDTAFDLVLMDIQLPGMNGYEVTQKLREINQSIPIVAVTAFAMVGDEEKALKAGCIDYITKPVIPNDLLKTVLKYI